MNIKISKNAHSCAACEIHFAHDQSVTSSVRVVEGALQREDFCIDCWAEQSNKKAYSIWKMVYFDPKSVEDQPTEVFSPLRQLFYEAAAEESRVEMAKAFLAAGLLRRQKVFRLIKESDESDGEVRVTLYTDRIGARLIEVPDPQFSYAEMEEARNLLLVRLQELEKAAEIEASEDDAAAEENGATDDAPPSPEDATRESDEASTTEDESGEDEEDRDSAEEPGEETTSEDEETHTTEDESGEEDEDRNNALDTSKQSADDVAAPVRSDDQETEENVEVDVHSGVASSLDATMTPQGEETVHA